MTNPFLLADSYKLSHFKQYPKGTEHLYSYIEPRKSEFPVVILGISYFIKLLGSGPAQENLDELKTLADLHGVPWNEEGFQSLVDKYEGRYWPLRISGVPEGTVVSPGTPVVSVVNTDPEFAWLESFFETLALSCVWYPSTVASVSRSCKTSIKKYMEMTGADMSTLDFKLHDFGARGSTCGEAQGIGGAAHLTQFSGTDTLASLKFAKDHYGADCAGFSIAASEHSTVTSWGRENEREMYKQFIKDNLMGGRIAACVSDSYDINRALDMWYSLKGDIVRSGGTLVIRPDSGHPVSTPVRVIEMLMILFGSTENSKGYRVLPSYIRVIQGDGITPETLLDILAVLEARGISIDNIAFGMGGGLLQNVNRDTCGFAMKCSAIRVNGEWRDVYKDPIAGGKTSKKGLVMAIGKADKATIIDGPEITAGPWVDYMFNSYVRPVDSWETIKERASV